MFRILVAEDDASTSKLLCAILQIHGYEPVPVYDGAQALAKLDEIHIDLLICDVMMPRMDGFQLTKAIRDGGSMNVWSPTFRLMRSLNVMDGGLMM